MASNMKLVSCPNCGTTFAVPEGFSSVKCPSCGYNMALVNQEVLGFPAYMLAVQVPRGEVVQILIEEMNKQVGLDEKFLENVAKADVELLLVPFMVFNSHSRAVFHYRGMTGDVAYLGEVAVPLNGWFYVLKGLSIPPASRVPLDVNLMNNATIIPLKLDTKAIRPEVTIQETSYIYIPGLVRRRIVIKNTDCSEADRLVGLVKKEVAFEKCYNPREVAEEVVKERLNELVMARGADLVPEYHLVVEPTGVVFVPIYYVRYKGSNGKPHVALVNGSSGEVLVASYEENSGFRAKALLFAGSSLLTGAISYALIGLPGFIVGLLAAVPFFFKGAIKVHHFGSRSGLLEAAAVGLIVKGVERAKQESEEGSGPPQDAEKGAQ